MENKDLLDIKMTVHEIEARLSRIESNQQDLFERLSLVEAFFDSIEKITTDYQEGEKQ